MEGSGQELDRFWETPSDPSSNLGGAMVLFQPVSLLPVFKPPDNRNIGLARSDDRT